MVARLASLSLLLVLTLPLSPAIAGDPCRPRSVSGLAWHTTTGCLEVPWDHADPDEGRFSIYYEISRPRGPSQGVILLFHGGPGYPRRHLQEEGPFWHALRAHFTICYFHQRGTGYSARVPTAEEMAGREHLFTLDHIVADTRALHQALFAGRPVILMGKSAGGFIALKYALRHPDEVRALVLAATSADHRYVSRRPQVKRTFFHHLDERYPGLLAAFAAANENLKPGLFKTFPALGDLLLPEDLLDDVVFDLSYTLAGQAEAAAIANGLAHGVYDLFLERLSRGRETLRLSGMESIPVLNTITCREFAYGRVNPAACEHLPEAATLYDLRLALPEISIPTLVLSGAHDPILPPRFQEPLATTICGPVAWHVLNRSGHMLFREEPTASLALLLDFFDLPRQQPPQLPAH